MKTLRIDSLTYKRLEKHARKFETPSELIQRALHALEHFEQGDSPASPHGSETDSERHFNTQRLPDLRFTKVLDATIGGKVIKRPKWNLLLQEMVGLAHEGAKGHFGELTRLCPTNMVPGWKVDEGYHYLSDINVSVQGRSANATCQMIVTTAQNLGIALSIGFMWRNREGATHPGERGRIEMPGSTSPLEDRTTILAEKKSNGSQKPTRKILLLNGPNGTGITARGYKDGNSFFVESGSKAAKNEAPSIRKTTSENRKKLLEQGIFEDEGHRYRLVQDHRFKSPSAASSILLGRESDGRTEWKDDAGRTLKELQEEDN